MSFMFDKLIEILNYIPSLLIKFNKLSKEEKNYFFAALIAPSLFFIYWSIVYITNSNIIEKFNYNISYIPISSKIMNNNVEKFEGTMFIFDSEQNQFNIQWNRNIQQIWTSLDSDVLNANRTKFIINNDNIELHLPLFCTLEPFIFFAEGSPKSKVNVIGKQLDINNIKLSSVNENQLSIAALLVAIFGFGAVIGTLNFGFD